MFKVNNKHISRLVLASVSIVNFEHVITDWVWTWSETSFLINLISNLPKFYFINTNNIYMLKFGEVFWVILKKFLLGNVMGYENPHPQIYI